MCFSVLEKYWNFTLNLYIDQKILSQVDSLRRHNLSLEYHNSQLQQVSILCTVEIVMTAFVYEECNGIAPMYNM